MAAICKVLVHVDWARLDKMRNECLGCGSITCRSSRTRRRRACATSTSSRVDQQEPIVLGDNLSNLPFMLKVFATVRNTSLSTGELDQVVAQFASTICNSQPVFAQVPAEQLDKVFTDAASNNMYYHLIRDVMEQGQKLQIREDDQRSMTEEYLNLRMRVKAWMRWRARRMTQRPPIQIDCSDRSLIVCSSMYTCSF